MRPRPFVLELGPESQGPLQLRIARAVAQAIRGGRLKPGEALPGSRELADQVGVHRNTVMLAFQELTAEGWVVGRRGSGTFVADQVPELTPLVWGSLGAAPPSDQAGFDLPSRLSPLSPLLPAQFNLNLAARPDARLAPVEELAKAYQRALRLQGTRLLEDANPLGHSLLRQELSGMLSRWRGISADPEQILITRGSRMAAGLVVFSLLQDGGRIAVEDPGNPGLWNTLRLHHGIHLSPIPVDGDGVRSDKLATLCSQTPPKLLCLTPHVQHPTGAMMPPERKREVMALAQCHRIAIMEEDPDSAFNYGASRSLPLASDDPTGQVIHLGSLGRLLAPELRLGFLVAPKSLVHRLARVRQRMGWQGDPVLECAVGNLFRDGIVERHLLRVRKIYQERRDRMLSHLQAQFADRMTWKVPEAGLGVWVEGQPSFNLDDWILRARARGVWMEQGSNFTLDNRELACTRMGFAAMDETEMTTVFDRLASL